MESLRSFVSFSGGEISKDTKSYKRNLKETTERETEEKSEVSQGASDRTQDDGADNPFEAGLSLYCLLYIIKLRIYLVLANFKNDVRDIAIIISSIR